MLGEQPPRFTHQLVGLAHDDGLLHPSARVRFVFTLREGLGVVAPLPSA
jgi:hypothetical protein